MKCKYAVTFEYETLPPQTYRGEMEASNPGAICNRSIKKAQKELKPIRWSSLVVLLERIGSSEEMSESDLPEDTPSNEEQEESIL